MIVIIASCSLPNPAAGDQLYMTHKRNMIGETKAADDLRRNIEEEITRQWDGGYRASSTGPPHFTPRLVSQMTITRGASARRSCPSQLATPMHMVLYLYDSNSILPGIASLQDKTRPFHFVLVVSRVTKYDKHKYSNPMEEDEPKKQSSNRKRQSDNEPDETAHHEGADDDMAPPREKRGTGLSVASAAASGSAQKSQRKRKDGRLHVPKGSLTEEMLIEERNKVLERLKPKPKEEWTKEELAEERRTASRLSEFQSRSRWKKTVDDLKKTSEEQRRHGSEQQQQLAELQAELQSVQRENAILRQQLSMQPSLGTANSVAGVWPSSQPLSILPPPPAAPPPVGLGHLLRIRAAESTLQQQLGPTRPQITLQHQPPLQQATATATTETNVLVQLLQYMQEAQQQEQLQEHKEPSDFSGRSEADGPHRRREADE